jgi:hypothetical protein
MLNTQRIIHEITKTSKTKEEWTNKMIKLINELTNERNMYRRKCESLLKKKNRQ